MPSRHGAHNLDIYEPLDSGNGQPPSAGEAAPRGRRWCRAFTRSKCFNFVVAMMICANAVLIGLEADLGILGTGSPQWGGLQTDMDLIGVPSSSEESIRDRVRQGIDADSELKDNFEKQLRSRTNADIDLQDTLNLNKGSKHLKYGAYTSCEFFFAAFFLLELLFRMCDFGGSRGFCGDHWNMFDTVLALSGVLDVVLPFFLMHPGASSMTVTLLSVLRLTRALRVLRLFRVCNELKSTTWGMMSAFSSVLWIAAVVVIINFVTAALLTSLIGQKAYMWEEDTHKIDEWFGSVGRAMQTLFTVMTLSGWDEIATVLSKVVPTMIVGVFILLYIMLCFFTMLSLLTSTVNHSFAAAHKAEEQHKIHALEDFRAHFSIALTNLFSDCAQNSTGHLGREEYKAVLENNPGVLHQLKKLEIETTVADLMDAFDRLSQDSACSSSVKIDALVESLVHINCAASASEVFDVKYLLSAMRREVTTQISSFREEVAAQQKEASTQAAAFTEAMQKQLATIQQTVSALQPHIAGLSQTVESLSGKLAKLESARELDRTEVAAVRTTLQQSLDGLSLQLIGFAGMNSKLDALSIQIQTQATADEKVERLFDQLSRQLIDRVQSQMAASKKAEAEGAGTPKSNRHAGQPEATIGFQVEASPDSKDPEVVTCKAAPEAEHAEVTDKAAELVVKTEAAEVPGASSTEPAGPAPASSAATAAAAIEGAAEPGPPAAASAESTSKQD